MSALICIAIFPRSFNPSAAMAEMSPVRNRQKAQDQPDGISLAVSRAD
ncbi:hypothetical protein [Pseudomonas floridensis]|nr:hypothetical protein [Pseudomonas floridensis]